MTYGYIFLIALSAVFSAVAAALAAKGANADAMGNAIIATVVSMTAIFVTAVMSIES